MKESNTKPAFLIYWSIYPAIEELSFEEKGKLFDSIFLYTMGKEIVEMTGATKMAFNFIKQSLDLDTSRYEAIVERNRINGLKGGRPRNPENPVGYLVTQRNPEEPKKANKNINKNKKEKNIDIMSGKTYLETWNGVFGTNYTSSKQIDKPLTEWLTTYSIEQICEAVENIKYDEYWKDKDLDPTWLLRFKDSSGDIDRIGKMLNTKKISKIVMNRIDTL